MDRSRKQEELSLKEAVEYFCWDTLEDRHGGWEINEGGSGEFVLDVATRTITLTHEQAFIEYETSEEKL